MWFSSYLTNRQQHVELDGISSDLKPLFTGMSQGSIIGPLFFIYMNGIPQSRQHFKYSRYADDMALFTTVEFRSATQIDINKELSNVHNWLAINKLSLM